MPIFIKWSLMKVRGITSCQQPAYRAHSHLRQVLSRPVVSLRIEHQTVCCASHGPLRSSHKPFTLPLTPIFLSPNERATVNLTGSAQIDKIPLSFCGNDHSSLCYWSSTHTPSDYYRHHLHTHVQFTFVTRSALRSFLRYPFLPPPLSLFCDSS